MDNPSQQPLLDAVISLPETEVNLRTQLIAYVIVNLTPRQKEMIRNSPGNTFVIRAEMKRQDVKMSVTDFNEAYNNLCDVLDEAKAKLTQSV